MARKRSPSDTIDGQHQQRPGNGHGDEGWTTVPAGGSTNGRKKHKKNSSAQSARSHRDEIDRAVASGEIAVPLFQFNTAGFKGKHIGVAHVRDLMLHILAKESYPQWLKISNKRAIRGVVCLLIQGIIPADLGLPNEAADTLPQALNASVTKSASKLPIFQKLFSHYCPTRAPGDPKKLHSVVQTLLNCQIPQAEREKKLAAKLKASESSQNSHDPAVYLLSPDVFEENGYIMPDYHFDPAGRVLQVDKGEGTSQAWQKPQSQPFERWLREDGLIQTPQPDDGAGGSPDDVSPLRILGIDCEMCKTTEGTEVCRVSVVDGEGNLVYNTLVKPGNPVVDYATAYSGITEELLAPVTTTLLDVQRRLAEIIDYDTVLVGHSLNCDLVVLKLAHPWIIDTSVLYHHTRGPPYKASLKWLAQRWLQREIQQPAKLDDGGQTLGHNSEEDARAAVELVRLKMQKGPGFGEFATDQESIFERLSRAEPPVKTAIVDHGNPGQWHGAKADTAVACRADHEVVNGVAQHVRDHDMVFARLLDVSHALGWSSPSNSALKKTAAAKKHAAISSDSPAATPADVDDDLAASTAVNGQGHKDGAPQEDIYARLNDQLTTIHQSLPINTALVVMSGHGDPRTVSSLSAKKNRFDMLYKTTKLSKIDHADRWMEEDERALVSAVARVREGMTFLAIKR